MDFPDIRPSSNLLRNTRTSAIRETRSSHRYGPPLSHRRVRRSNDFLFRFNPQIWHHTVRQPPHGTQQVQTPRIIHMVSPSRSPDHPASRGPHGPLCRGPKSTGSYQGPGRTPDHRTHHQKLRRIKRGGLVRTHQDQRSQEIIPLVHGGTTENSTGLVRNLRKHFDAFGTWCKPPFDLPPISLSDLIWTEMHRGSTDRPTFGSLPSRQAEKPQPPRSTKHRHPTHLNVVATPTVPRHRLQPVDCQGSTARATSNFKTTRSHGPNDHRCRCPQRQRMDQNPGPVSISGIIQAARLFRPQ